MASWTHRTVLAGLLLATYLFAWTPARSVWLEHGAAPLLASVTKGTVTARAQAHTVRVQPADGAGFTYRAPAGIKFLLPGLFLLLIAPARHRLWAFWAGHLGVSSLVLLLTASGGAGAAVGLCLARFVQAYGIDAYSLMVPVLVVARYRRRDR